MARTARPDLYTIPTRAWPGQVSPEPAPVVGVVGGSYLPLTGGVMLGNIDPNAANVRNLGNITEYWQGVYTTAVFANQYRPVSGGTMTAVGEFVPGAASTYDLGVAGTRWDFLHVDTVTLINVAPAVGTTIFSSADWLSTGALYDLGNATFYWQLGFIDDLAVDTLTSRSATDHVLVIDDLDPNANSTYDLGDSSLAWLTAKIVTVYTDVITSLAGTAYVRVTDDLQPTVGGTYDLGDATNYWAIGYVDKIFTDTLDDRTGGPIDLITTLITSTKANLGDGTNYFSNIYTQNLQSPASGAVYIDCATDLVSSSHYDLGDGTNYWLTAHIDQIYGVGGNLTIVDNLVPDGNYTRDLGSASKFWNDIYGDWISLRGGIIMNSYLEMDAESTPAAPDAAECRIYMYNNGGQYELRIIFGDSTVKTIATDA